MLAGELLMALDAVLGDAEHGGSRGGEFLAQRSEIERFFRASGGIVLGKEIDDQLPAVEIAKADRLAAFALHGEIRRLISSPHNARREDNTSQLHSLNPLQY